VLSQSYAYIVVCGQTTARASLQRPVHIAFQAGHWKQSTTGFPYLRFSVTAVWSCGSLLRLASSSRTNQTGFAGFAQGTIMRRMSRSSHAE